MRRDLSTRVRVTFDECAMNIAALDSLLGEMTDLEQAAFGDSILDLRARFSEARDRALKLRGRTTLEALPCP